MPTNAESLVFWLGCPGEGRSPSGPPVARRIRGQQTSTQGEERPRWASAIRAGSWTGVRNPLGSCSFEKEMEPIGRCRAAWRRELLQRTGEPRLLQSSTLRSARCDPKSRWTFTPRRVGVSMRWRNSWGRMSPTRCVDAFVCPLTWHSRQETPRLGRSDHWSLALPVTVPAALGQRIG